MEFVVNRIPDGVPVRVYLGEIGDDTDVTDDFDALKDEDAVYHIIEGAGSGALGAVSKVFGFILKPIAKLFGLNTATNANYTATNNQTTSPNNSLTDRSNKPRPYERSYDICGTVQTIPNDLMQTYKAFNSTGALLEYSYYDAGRGHLHIESDGVTEGDTLISDITGSSVAVYAPYTSPNNTTSPQLQIGDVIDQKLYVTYSNDDVDGIVLKAPNDIGANPSAGGTAKRITNTGYIYDPSGDSAFSEFLSVGDVAVLRNFDVKDIADLNGSFEVLYVDDFEVRLAVNGASNWGRLNSGQTYALTERSDTFIGPSNTYDVSLTDWYYMVRGEVDRVLANVAGQNGLYKYDGGYNRTSVTPVPDD